MNDREYMLALEHYRATGLRVRIAQTAASRVRARFISVNAELRRAEDTLARAEEAFAEARDRWRAAKAEREEER